MNSRLIENNKNISLASYVFLILGLFLIVLASIQLVFIQHIEQRIQDEIADRSAKLSSQVVEFVLQSKFSDIEKKLQESLALNQPIIAKRRLFISKGENTRIQPPQVKQLTELKLQALAESEIVQKEELTKDQTSEVKEIINLLRNRLDNMQIKRAEGNTFVFTSPDFLKGEERMLTANVKESAVAEYFHLLTLSTLVLALFSLLFAYWLSRHVSRPLMSLKKGLLALSQGDFSYRLKPEGVKEVQQTLRLFNDTSKQVAHLHSLETKFLQQQQLAELGEVSRGMAHSLRNPLNTIGLALEEISQAGVGKQRQAEIVAQARQKIIALDNTIKSLLLLTTAGISRMELVSLNGIVDDAVIQISMGTGHNIRVDAKQALSIRGSSAELAAVLMTLLSNAVEASEAGGYIQVKLTESAGRYVIQVIDRGQGLSTDIEQRLFQPHVTTKAEGAGMGLYIAKRIVTLHYSGDLFLTNNKDSGCTATLSLFHAEPDIRKESSI
jgi:signal transduction histidine kinase